MKRLYSLKKTIKLEYSEWKRRKGEKCILTHWEQDLAKKLIR